MLIIEDNKLILEHCHPLMAVLSSFLLICILSSKGTILGLINAELNKQYNKNIEKLKKTFNNIVSGKEIFKHPSYIKILQCLKSPKEYEDHIFNMRLFIMESESFDASQLQDAYGDELKPIIQKSKSLNTDITPPLSSYIALLYAVTMLLFDLLSRHYHIRNLIGDIALSLTIITIIYIAWRFFRMFVFYCISNNSEKKISNILDSLLNRKKGNLFYHYTHSLNYSSFTKKYLYIIAYSFVCGIIISGYSQYSSTSIRNYDLLNICMLSLTIWFGLIFPFSFSSFLYWILSKKAIRLQDGVREQYETRVSSLNNRANAIMMLADKKWYDENQVCINAFQSGTNKANDEISLTVKSKQYIGSIPKRIGEKLRGLIKA